MFEPLDESRASLDYLIVPETIGVGGGGKFMIG